MKDKLALFCNVDEDCIIQNMDAESLYEIPIMLEKEGIAKVACKKLGVLDKQPDMSEWLAMLEKERNMDKKIQIALVGKYVELHDAYLSIVESLHHGGIIATGADVEINWINAEYLTEQNIANMLSKCHGILSTWWFWR